MQTESFEPVVCGAFLRPDFCFNISMSMGQLGELSAGVHDVSTSCDFPDGKIVARVTGIVESLFAEFSDQSIALLVGRKIGAFVGG
ncbi:hypothetical protein D3C80_1468240 [compost metagenome]